jgi:hypothetical protein
LQRRKSIQIILGKMQSDWLPLKLNINLQNFKSDSGVSQTFQSISIDPKSRSILKFGIFFHP